MYIQVWVLFLEVQLLYLEVVLKFWIHTQRRSFFCDIWEFFQNWRMCMTFRVGETAPLMVSCRISGGGFWCGGCSVDQDNLGEMWWTRGESNGQSRGFTWIHGGKEKPQRNKALFISVWEFGQWNTWNKKNVGRKLKQCATFSRHTAIWIKRCDAC